MYVHCEQGIGRTGCVVAAYRVRVQGWTPEAAVDEACAHGLKMPCQQEWIRGLRKTRSHAGNREKGESSMEGSRRDFLKEAGALAPSLQNPQ